MKYKDIIYTKDKAKKRATIMLNRPEKLNSTTLDMDAEIAAAIKESEADDNVKVVIIKGSGRAFSTGHDLTEVGFIYGWEVPKSGEKVRRPAQKTRLRIDRDRLMQPWPTVFHSIKPTIAQVHGYALEGGCWLQLACDMAVASEDAVFGYPGQRLAFAGAAPIQLLTFAVGTRVARELILTGRYVDAKEAQQMGLINRVVPNDKLEEEVDKLADGIAKLPGDALVIGKMCSLMAYDTMGMTSFNYQFPIAHTLGTNLRFEDDEHNFFKSRRDKGAKAAFHERDARLTGLV